MKRKRKKLIKALKRVRRNDLNVEGCVSVCHGPPRCDGPPDGYAACIWCYVVYGSDERSTEEIVQHMEASH